MMSAAVAVHQNIQIYPHYPAADSIVLAAPLCSAILLVTFDLPRKKITTNIYIFYIERRNNQNVHHIYCTQRVIVFKINANKSNAYIYKKGFVTSRPGRAPLPDFREVHEQDESAHNCRM